MQPRAARALVAVFLLAIFGVPVSQAIYERAVNRETPRVVNLFRQAPSEEHLRSFEEELEEASLAAEAMRPAFRLARWLLLHDLGDKATAGRNGWCYYDPEIRYLGERDFRKLPREEGGDDPLEVIADFAGQLRKRGVHLLVVPVPSKPSVYPEGLRRTARPGLEIAAHTLRFVRDLRSRSVDVVELHSVLLQARGERPAGPPLYLAADTHWTGEGVRIAAQAIAARVRALAVSVKLGPRVAFSRSPQVVLRQGDIPRMVRLPLAQKIFAAEPTTVYRVYDSRTHEPYEDSDEASVLLLGDSFSRIYQTDDPESAGLIANLAYELSTPLTSIVNDGGASTLVRQELARSTFLLRGKRLVIWAFAERDLRFGMKGWQRIQL